MSKILNSILWAFFVILCYSLSAAGGLDFNKAADNSMYSDHKARGVGDLLTVLITENAQATHTAKTTTKKNHKTEATGGPGTGVLDLIPDFGFSGEGKNEYDGEGSTVKSGSMKARMTVKVVGIKENGNLLIEGTRVLGVNDDKEALILKGEVRPEDIMDDNSIYSYNIGNAEIDYKGKGVANTGGKPGIIARFLNWLF
jgi:flagellar L-ring protein precursor FlgH